MRPFLISIFGVAEIRIATLDEPNLHLCFQGGSR